jgi:hypothetical protein
MSIVCACASVDASATANAVLFHPSVTETGFCHTMQTKRGAARRPVFRAA